MLIIFQLLLFETAPSYIVFHNDGTKMYVLGDTGNDVNEYHLTTAYDIASATYATRFSVGGQESSPIWNGIQQQTEPKCISLDK